MELGGTLKLLLDKALKSNTQRTYSSAQKRFLKFCIMYDLTPCPATEQTLLYFVSYLFSDGLKGSSIRCYLSAVRNLHIANDIQYIGVTPKLQMALKGACVLSAPPRRMKPINFAMLSKMIQLLKGRSDSSMLSAALSLGFFGCLRSGEFCLPDAGVFDPTIHLRIKDVTLLKDEKMFSLLLRLTNTVKGSQSSWGVRVLLHVLIAPCGDF